MVTIVRFDYGDGFKKYRAYLSNGKTVQFGDTRYEHYKDITPKSLGGGLWTHQNHLDKFRRANYRKRHGALVCKNGQQCISIKYSPAWFSYKYLW